VQARSLDKIRKPGAQQRLATGERRRREKKQSVSGTKPEFVPPMLAKLVRALPEGPGWSFEVKFDGYRIEAIKNGPEVRLQSSAFEMLPKHPRLPILNHHSKLGTITVVRASFFV
jgi:ATP-dependent DNA ligase